MAGRRCGVRMERGVGDQPIDGLFPQETEWSSNQKVKYGKGEKGEKGVGYQRLLCRLVGKKLHAR